MVALQENLAGLLHLAVDFTPGRLVAFDLVVNLLPVERERDLVADDGGLGGLPFAAGLGGEFRRSLEVVNRPVPSQRRLAAFVVAEDLNLVPAPQVKAAVGIIRHLILVLHGEVPILLVRDEVSAVLAALDGVLENSVFDRPTVVTFRIAQMPAVGVRQ